MRIHRVTQGMQTRAPSLPRGWDGEGGGRELKREGAHVTSV